MESPANTSPSWDWLKPEGLQTGILCDITGNYINRGCLAEVCWPRAASPAAPLPRLGLGRFQVCVSPGRWWNLPTKMSRFQPSMRNITGRKIRFQEI